MSESISGETSVNSKADLPPPRDRKGIRPVSPPLSNMSVRRFSHYMTFALALIIAFYAWRLTVWKAEAGSWWNLVLGKQPPAFRDGNTSGGPAVPNVTPTMGSGRDVTVEERIHELAVALGMPSKDLASAIAVAVHEHVPPATLSSLAAHQTGEAVQYLVNPEAASASDASASEIAPAASNAANSAAKLFDAVVGMDEPAAEMM